MSNPIAISPGFHVIHANLLEDLRRAVIWICKKSPLRPLENETFLVQSNGIAQWLKLALAEKPSDDGTSGGFGIAAGIDFLFPSRFIWQAYRAVLPQDSVPDQSPFDKRQLVWRLFRLLPEIVESDKSYAPLKRFLDGSDQDVRCFQLAEKVADLFDQYQVFRADWLSDWAAGENHVITPRKQKIKLDDEFLWQPSLWRALVADVGDGSETSRSQIHTRFMTEGSSLSAPANPSMLPRRIIVFGVSSLPRQALEALQVLSKFSQVILCVNNPCQYYWADIISDRDLLTAARKRGKQRPKIEHISDTSLMHQHANPLLATWGKQGRDYVRLLDEFDNPDEYRTQFDAFGQRIDIFADHGEGLETPRILQQIQNDVLNLNSTDDIQAESRELNLQLDHSLVFHVAHSPLREVEILHDQLLAAFTMDPALRPQDVIVMVPDINDYAAYIRAVFGRHHHESKLFIPFTISDQSRRNNEPILIALETLLSLPQSRFGASEIISLLEVSGIRQRFDIGEEDIPLIRTWIEGANIRWGLHSEHRVSLGLPAGLERNTWQSGIRSMLLGYAVGEGQPWNEVEPYGEIGGLRATLAGKLSVFVQRLEELWTRLQENQTPTAWESQFSWMLEYFFRDLADTDLLLLNRFRRQLEQWLGDVRSAGIDEQKLPLNIVKDILLNGLDEEGLNQRFLAGKVNFATLMPMRAIPFKRVCLLGMNDGDYPRSRPPVDFDLMAKEYRPGDRSRREDDRYLFLEAMLSARQQLYISWVGRSIRDDSERPASVLVSQLQNYIDSSWALPHGAKVTASLTTHHPLQPFSPRYFPSDTTNDDQVSPLESVLESRRLFTFEHEWRSVHDKAGHAGNESPLEYVQPEEPISLGDIARFLKKPVETFYQRRLQVSFEGDEDTEIADADTENFDLPPLVKWQLDDELIRTCVLEASTEKDLTERINQAINRMKRRGDLGMGITEAYLEGELKKRLTDQFKRYQAAIAQWPNVLPDPVLFEYQVTNEIGRVETADLITGVRKDENNNLCRLVVARSGLLENAGKSKKPKYPNLIADWVIHLAGQLSDQPFESLILAKEEGRNFRFEKMDKQDAQNHLNKILDQWIRGMTQPLPMHCVAGFAWLYSMCRSSNQLGNSALADEKAAEMYDNALSRDTGYLRGSFESFDAMDSVMFRQLAEDIYKPLQDMVDPKSNNAAGDK